MPTIAGINTERRGSGPPMLLIHGVGSRWQMWEPVFDLLARRYDVVAVDLPGFGASAAGEDVSIAGLAGALERLLDELGWTKAHLVGNSLGGWLGFELAVRGRALSVCGLAPAGLWKDTRQRKMAALFAFWSAAGGVLARVDGLLRFAVVRTIALFGLFGKPWRIPPEVAKADLHNFLGPGLRRTLPSLIGHRFEGGRGLTIPVTVVWCSVDPLFHSSTADMSELPANTRVARLFWVGHVPTWDAPGAVVEVISETASWASPVTAPRPAVPPAESA
jgi:pimeloyl-ACP methyl ester carboxylesterase